VQLTHPVVNEYDEESYSAIVNTSLKYYFQISRDFQAAWADYPDGTYRYRVDGLTMLYLAKSLGWKLIAADCPPIAECKFDLIWKTPDGYRVNVVFVDDDA